MPKRTLKRLTAVKPARGRFAVLVTWQDGSTSRIDLSELIASYKVYAPLRTDPALFGAIRPGEFGTDIVWTDDIDMSADTLWRLAQEQAGITMSPAQFRQWRERSGLSLSQAAAALGLSRRSIAYYEDGTKPIPRVVALATQALEAQPQRAA